VSKAANGIVNVRATKNEFKQEIQETEKKEKRYLATNCNAIQQDPNWKKLHAGLVPKVSV